MNTARVDKVYMELVRKFPLVPLRDKPEFDEAIKVMKRLAYRRSSLSNGEADYLTVLGDLIAQYEKKLPRLAEEQLVDLQNISKFRRHCFCRRNDVIPGISWLTRRNWSQDPVKS